MKLSEFILLNEEEKKLAVLHEGVLVAKRKNDDSMVFLFQLKNYYVEAFFRLENKAIKEYRVFDDTKPLHPYLESIPLGDLLT